MQFRKVTFLLVALVIPLTGFLSAQRADPVDNLEDKVDVIDVIDDIDVIKPTKIPHSPAQEAHPCSRPILSLPIPITLASGPICYVELEGNPSAAPAFLTALSENGHRVETKEAGPNGYLFSRLRPDETYNVFYHDNCGIPRTAGTFHSTFKSGQNIDVDFATHRVIKSWIRRGKFDQKGLFTAIRNGGISEFKQASFIQRFFLKGKAVDSVEELKRIVCPPPPPPPPPPSTVTCNCETVRVPSDFEFNPGNIPSSQENGAIAFDDTFEPDEGTNSTIEKLEFFTREAGPARAWYSYSDGWKERRNQWYGGTVGLDADTDFTIDQEGFPSVLGSRISQVFTLLCTSSVGDPCGCEKELKAIQKYASIVSVRANGGSGGGTRRTIAIGEDIGATFSIEETEDGADFQLLEGTRNLRSATCNQEPNDAFTTGLVNVISGLAAVGAALFLQSSDLAPSSPQGEAALLALTGQFAGQVLTNLPAVFTEEATITENEDCGPENGSVSQTSSAIRSFQLKPNRSLILGIASDAQMVNRGMRSWQSEVSIRSSFFISTFQPAGIGVGSDDPACCAPNHEGHYWGKAFDEEDIGQDNQPHFLSIAPPLNQQQVRSQIANHYLATTTPDHWDFAIDDLGDFTVPFDFGHLVGNLLVDGSCKLEIKRASQDFFSHPFSPAFIEMTSANPFSDQLSWRITSGDATRAELTVISPTGKILMNKTYSLTPDASNQVAIRGLGHWSSGLYFYRIELNNGEGFSGKLIRH